MISLTQITFTDHMFFPIERIPTITQYITDQNSTHKSHFFFTRKITILTVIEVEIGVERPHDEFGAVQHSVCVYDVGAEIWVHVFGSEIVGGGSVVRPAGEVTHHFVFCAWKDREVGVRRVMNFISDIKGRICWWN